MNKLYPMDDRTAAIHVAARATNGPVHAMTRAIVFTAAVTAALVALAVWTGSRGAPTLVLPWFIPTIDSFLFLVAVAVSYLALGRLRVLNDAASFWTTAAFCGFAVSIVFHLLSFPNLSPSGGSLIGREPAAPPWAIFSAGSCLALGLLKSSLAGSGAGGATHLRRNLVLLACLVAGIAGLHFVVIVAGPYVPDLLRQDGSIRMGGVLWNLAIAVASATGAVLSTRRYRSTGDTLHAYTALCQFPVMYFSSVVAFAQVARFDGWWYSIYFGWAAGLVTVLLGLLSGLVRLFRRDQEIAARLRESEAKFRAVFEQAPVGIGRVRFTDARWMDVNQAFCQMLGRSKEEMLATPWPDITHPDDVDLDLLPFKRMAAGELDRYSVEKRFFRKDGQIIWARLALSLVRDARGRPDHEIAIVEDITEQRKAEEALAASEARFRSVVENMSEGLMLFDAGGNLVYQNPSSLRIHGFASGQDGRIPSDQLSATWDAWDENGRPIAFEDWPVSHVFRHERFKEQVLHVRRRETGREFYASYNGSPIYDSNGKLVLGFITIRDLTDQVRADEALRKGEAELRAYADAMPQMAFISDTAGQILFYNRQHYEYFGAATPAIHPDEIARAAEAWSESLETGKPYEIEYRLRRRDGQYRWHLGRAIPYRDDSGTISRWFGTNTDIHDQKQISEALKEAVQARDEFISIASHELKTPLTSMRMQMQLMKRRVDRGRPEAVDPEAVVQLVGVSIRQLNRLNHLVEDMLDISRISTGRLTVERESVDLGELVREVADRFHDQFVAARCELRLHLQPGVIGDWDRFRIEQVVTNLLANAVKYASGTPVEVTVDRTSDGRAMLSVRDHGPGIPEGAEGRIFGRFERATSYTSVSGLGLGLYITNQILQLHGGTIRAQNDQGGGANFIVELPAGTVANVA